jgi:hypothetical protein
MKWIFLLILGQLTFAVENVLSKKWGFSACHAIIIGLLGVGSCFAYWWAFRLHTYLGVWFIGMGISSLLAFFTNYLMGYDVVTWIKLLGVFLILAGAGLLR